MAARLIRMIAATIAQEIGVRPDQVETALTLLAEGNTVPFIARYRKEVTGGLDDTQLRTIETRATYLRELEERKQAILEAIEEQGKLNDDLRREILECDLRLEISGIQDLKDAIAYFESIGDYGSRDLAEEILESEEEHIDWLETQLGLIDKVGLENYQQSQISN